jgi:hypothetical protein
MLSPSTYPGTRYAYQLLAQWSKNILLFVQRRKVLTYPQKKGYRSANSFSCSRLNGPLLVQPRIRYSHAMICLLASLNNKWKKAIMISLNDTD